MHIVDRERAAWIGIALCLVGTLASATALGDTSIVTALFALALVGLVASRG